MQYTTKSDRFTLVSAVHLFLADGGRVLLPRRFNTGYEDGNFSVVAGHLDGGEEVVSAAIREAREEVGIGIRRQDLTIVGVKHRLVENHNERIDYVLVAERWSGDIRNAEPHKCDLFRWVPIDHLPENVDSYVRREIANYRHGVAFDSFGWNGDEH